MEQQNFGQFVSAVKSDITAHKNWLLNDCHMPKDLMINCIRDELKDIIKDFESVHK
jgi:hypothetical protein